MKTSIRVALMLAVSASVHAQQAQSCAPGAAFGVRAYQCASCSMKFASNGRHQFSFQSEPVVLESTGNFRRGDVIVSVGYKPITTQDGADAFTYPHPGGDGYRIEYRRGTELLSMFIVPESACEVPPRVIGSHKETRSNVTAERITTNFRDSTTKMFNATVRVSDTISGTTARTAKFGFALGCIPSCSRVRRAGGIEHWRYDGYPVVAVVAQGLPADRAGVKVGDLLLSIGDQSVLEEEGALALQNSDKRDTLTLTLLRDAVEKRYTLIITKAVRDSLWRSRDSTVRELFDTLRARGVPKRDTVRRPPG